MIEQKQLLGILLMCLISGYHVQARELPLNPIDDASVDNAEIEQQIVNLFNRVASTDATQSKEGDSKESGQAKNDKDNSIATEQANSHKVVEVIDFTKRYPDPLVESTKNTTPVKSRALARSVSYTIKGKTYRTLADSQGFTQEGGASWYGPGFHGRKTASGEIYNMEAMTAAHKILPLGTKVEVTNLSNGKSIVVRINDRGPFHGNRVLDLSRAAARELDVIKHGVANVSIRALH